MSLFVVYNLAVGPHLEVAAMIAVAGLRDSVSPASVSAREAAG